MTMAVTKNSGVAISDYVTVEAAIAGKMAVEMKLVAVSAFHASEVGIICTYVSMKMKRKVTRKQKNWQLSNQKWPSHRLHQRGMQ